MRTYRNNLPFNNKDKGVIKSIHKYKDGGSITIDGKQAKYKVKYHFGKDKHKDGYIVEVLTPSGHAIDHYLLYDKSKKLIKELSHQEAHQLVAKKNITLIKTYNIDLERLEIDIDKPVKDMNYSEQRNWIEDHIVPKLKSATLHWRSYNGDSYGINEDERFIEDSRQEATYANTEAFESSTGFKVDESGWGIETEDGEELDEVASDITYNWSYLGVVTWNFRVYKADEEKYFLIAHPHMGGDVRGNYGEPIFFEGESLDSVMYDFREKILDGGRTISFEFKDGTEVYFDAQQDSDVSYYELLDTSSGKKIKLNSPAELLISTFETFGGWNGDGFLEEIVDEFKRTGNSSDEEEELRRGGRLKSQKQKREQYHDRDVEKYGSRDSSVRARPVGYRYRKVRDKKTGRLRLITKDDKEYYGKVTEKDIKLYEEGNKDARRRIYFENRKDHSDKNPTSKHALRTYSKGGGFDSSNEMKYHGVTITMLKSGYYEVYSDERGRFLKFDELDSAKDFIDSEYGKRKGGKLWIAKALGGGKNKGALRRTAMRKGLLRGKDDTLSKTDLHKLEKMGGKTAKRAYFAETLSRFDEGGGMGHEGHIKSGNYLDLDVTKNGNLKISINDEAREKIAEMRENDECDDCIMNDLFDDIRGNSELMYFGDAGEMGFGLTSAPCITDGYYYDDDGELTDEGNDDSQLYYHESYMITSFIDEMLEKGYVIFDKA